MCRRPILPYLAIAALAVAPAPGALAAGGDAHAPSPPQAGAGTQPPTSDQLYDLGKDLFDEYAPPEVKEQYEFPSRKEWDDFATKLQRALDGDSMEKLAAYEPQARAALAALRLLPGMEGDAAWLEERIDMIEAARRVQQRAPSAAPAPGLPPQTAPAATPRRDQIPYYDLWMQRLRGRPLPPNAAELIPRLSEDFSAAGVPAQLAWLAEVESSLNPNARSPTGAKGLFQLMPDTAKSLGLSTWLPDDRTNPDKSARAAAQLLLKLRERFGDWPLALAAYNAGENRVSRALSARKATTFAEIAPSLSVETRFYVPKVLATIALRTGVPPGKLGAPRR